MLANLGFSAKNSINSPTNTIVPPMQASITKQKTEWVSVCIYIYLIIVTLTTITILTFDVLRHGRDA
jgi:ABC-type arginine transport system permease subunit